MPLFKKNKTGEETKKKKTEDELKQKIETNLELPKEKNKGMFAISAFPLEILFTDIFSHLNQQDFQAAAVVSAAWNRLVKQFASSNLPGSRKMVPLNYLIDEPVTKQLNELFVFLEKLKKQTKRNDTASQRNLTNLAKDITEMVRESEQQRPGDTNANENLMKLLKNLREYLEKHGMAGVNQITVEKQIAGGDKQAMEKILSRLDAMKHDVEKYRVKK